jgi:hypothetical protein
MEIMALPYRKVTLQYTEYSAFCISLYDNAQETKQYACSGSYTDSCPYFAICQGNTILGIEWPRRVSRIEAMRYITSQIESKISIEIAERKKPNRDHKAAPKHAFFSVTIRKSW